MSAKPLRPFPVDPEVLAGIRPLRHRDIARVVALHRAAMGNSLWARLGTDFMVALYRGLIRNPAFLGFVYEEAGRVRGFIAGTSNAKQLFSDVLSREAKAFIRPTLKGLFRDPKVVGPLITTPFYFSRSDVPGMDIPAESLFCSFEPDLRGRRVSGLINKVLFDELLARGQKKVKITTETDNEGAVRQLSSWGFEIAGTMTFYGKEMYVFVLDLEECERVEACSRHPGPDPRGI